MQHYMTKNKVFAVVERGNVFVIDRTNGCLLHTLLNVHCDKGPERVGILGIRVFDEQILATASANGFIKFHRIDKLKSEIINSPDVEEMLISEENRYISGKSFTHLDHQGDNLVRKIFKLNTACL